MEKFHIEDAEAWSTIAMAIRQVSQLLLTSAVCQRYSLKEKCVYYLHGFAKNSFYKLY
jgi:hypothetical protein